MLRVCECMCVAIECPCTFNLLYIYKRSVIAGICFVYMDELDLHIVVHIPSDYVWY